MRRLSWRSTYLIPLHRSVGCGLGFPAFRQEASSTGIPLTKNFKLAYKGVAEQPTKEYAFLAQDSLGFFQPNSLSQDISYVNRSNRAYLAKERQAREIEFHSKSSMWPTAYLGSLISLRDALVLDKILLSLMGSL